QILYPIRSMPAKLVTGQDAKDVAAYVAQVAAAPGEDEGALATAVRRAAGGRAEARDGRLEIPADPNGQLAYTVTEATAAPGPLRIDSPNASSVPHDIAVQEGADGPELARGETVSDGGV